MGRNRMREGREEDGKGKWLSLGLGSVARTAWKSVVSLRQIGLINALRALSFLLLCASEGSWFLLLLLPSARCKYLCYRGYL